MAKTEQDCIKFIRIISQEHKNYWKEKSSELKKYKDAYESKFWKSEHYDNTMIRIETPDCFGYVEGFISSLFSKNPAVVIGKDIASTGGDPKLAQAAANRFLYNQREQLEIASRLAIIYDYSALKLSPQQSDEMLDKVTIRALPCWEIIVDRDASSFDDMRFIGHQYFLNMVEAKERFGAKNFEAVPKEDYFAVNTGSNNYAGQKADYRDLPDDYLYIEVTELYDILNDMVYYWSPSYMRGEKLLVKEQIPIRTYNDRPMSPISLLYFSRSPSKPMEGLSAVSRIYDQVYEKNILRTYWANAVRRDSRQYLYKEGVLDEEALAKVTAGIDGAMVAVDGELDGVIRPIPVEPITTNFDRYLAYIEQDLAKGSVLSPFSKGEATKATATEILALAQYSASEIGKMARDRDASLEGIVAIYLRQLILLADEGEVAVLDVEGEGKVVKPEDLEGKFRINALDQGSTPLSDATRKQNLVTLLPTLQALGVPQRAILEEIVRAYELNKTFLEIPEVASQAASAPGPSAADVGLIEGGITEQVIPAERLARAVRREK